LEIGTGRPFKEIEEEEAQPVATRLLVTPPNKILIFNGVGVVSKK